MFLRILGNDSSAPRRHSPLNLEALDERVVPAIIAANDTYTGIRGQVLTVDAKSGVLANDFSDSTFNLAVLSASLVGPPLTIGSTVPLPPDTIQLFPNGGFTAIIPSNLAPSVSAIQFTYRASNLLDLSEPTSTATVTINVVGAQRNLLAVGAQAGGSPIVKLYETNTGRLVNSFLAYNANFTGGVRVATGDVNGDGIDDIAVAPGPGGGDHIRIFSGSDLSVIFDGAVFNDPNFRGGAYVALGDIDGNGSVDLIVGAGEQGGPRVVALDVGAFGPSAGSPVVVLANFFAYESSFRNGVRVAAGDLAGIGRDYIVTVPGEGGGPVVKTFDYISVSGVLEGKAANNQPLLSFFAGDSADRRGLYVATGKVGATGRADIITGTGSGPASVSIFDGLNGGLIRFYNVPPEEVPVGGGNYTGPNANFFNPGTRRPQGNLLPPAQVPFALTSGATVIPGSGLLPRAALGGVTVTAADWDGNGLEDVIVGLGPGNPSRVKVFATTTNAVMSTFLAFEPTFLGGVDVG